MACWKPLVAMLKDSAHFSDKTFLDLVFVNIIGDKKIIKLLQADLKHESEKETFSYSKAM